MSEFLGIKPNGEYVENNTGSVSVMEKPRETVNNSPKTAEELEAAAQRMKRNLEKLLNYDVQTEEAELTPSHNVEEEVSAAPEIAVSEEDIRPTTTTMQFGTDDVDKMRNEMVADKEETATYKLNLKGKVAIAIYSVVVAIIMALIIINTGVLATLSRNNAAKETQLETLQSEYVVKTEEIASISQDDHVISVATNDLGMILGN